MPSWKRATTKRWGQSCRSNLVTTCGCAKSLTNHQRSPYSSMYGFGALSGYSSPSGACSLNGNVPTSSKDGGALRCGDVLDASAIDSTLK